jgi:RNA polymerase sigma factor for flagellar operon FliA
VNVEALYLQHRALIDRTVDQVCRRHHVKPADLDDFRSVTHLHVIDKDYAVLRAYQGRAEIGAFLQAVVRRLFQDWRNANWGRWRPSAAARRAGPVAVQLEMLAGRDRRPLGEAIEMLRANHGVTMTTAELEDLAARLPLRAPRTFTSEEVLAAIPDGAARPDAALAHEEIAEIARVSAALDAALAALPPDDRLLLRMRFEGDAPVSRISRVLGVPQHPLYRRLDRLLRDIRASLERDGVTESAANDVIGRFA